MRGWQIVKKDLKLLFRDRRALATLVALPLIFITVIGLTTGQLLGWADKNKVLTIALVDQTDPKMLDEQVADLQLPDRDTKLVRARNKNMAARLYNRLQQREGIEVQNVASVERTRKLSQNGDVDGILIIGPKFFDRVEELQMGDLLDSEHGKLAEGLTSLDMKLESVNETSSTHSIVEQFVMGDAVRAVGLYVVCRDNIGRNKIAQRCREFEAEADQAAIAFDPPQTLDIQSNAVYQEIIPGMTVMFVFFLVNIMAQSFIQERELGTLRRLRIAPIGSMSLLTGKTIPFLLISLAQTVLLFVCGKLVFGMDWGKQPALLLPVIFTTSIAATALGLMVATLVRTESQVSAYANLVVVGLAGISGCFMPREWLPSLMQEVSLYTPHAWALIAYEQLLRKPVPNVMTVMESCAMLFGFGVLFFCVGCLRFSKVE